MDHSGNSGSMQSSSGDEEYDSRPESAPPPPPPPPPPAFLNPHHYQNQQQQQLILPTFFDITSPNNYLHPALSQYQFQFQSQHNSNSSSFLNLGLVGPGTDKNLQVSSSSSSSSSIAAGYYHQGLINNRGSFTSPSYSSSSMQSRLLNNVNNNDRTNVVVKNPKKRTRTSRRAPTTVLTTDTSNFRSMVQEFTGIPAQPFSVGSPCYSRRLDLLTNYPLRPATQKLQPVPAFVSSSIAAAAAAAASTVTTSVSATTSHNMLNNSMQPNLNHPPLASFQSLLLQHSTTLIPSLNTTTEAAFPANKSQGGSFGMPSFEDHHHHQHLAMMSHGHARLPNQQDHSRSLEGNFGNSSSQRVTGCNKLNHSASSSDFHHEKNLENVSSRGEGTVDSWICPSD